MSDLGVALNVNTPPLDAGARGKRLAKFRPARSHINGAIAATGRTVLDRARYLVRNNPYASNGCEYYAAQLVGAGITPAWRARKAELERAWLRWTDEADAEGLTDFYGLQRRAARELFIAGEVFFRIRMRRPEDGLSVPLQLQMLASEMLPVEDHRTLANGNTVRAGVEFDLIGRRVAYWFYRAHPDDPTQMSRASGEQTRVPADQVLHILDPVEAGQIRGLSMMAPGIVKLWLLDIYDDAELDRKRTAALFTWFEVSPNGDPVTDHDDEGDGTGTLELGSGAGIRLAPGADVRFAAPADVGGNYEAFQYRNLCAAAAAVGLPYAGLTGDLTKVNYGSLRGGEVAFRRRAEATQHSVLIHQLCRRVGEMWMAQAVLAGAIEGLTPAAFSAARAQLLPIPWAPPKWDWIDPLKDVKADREEVEAGFASRSAQIRRRGYDPEQVDAERAADMEREKALGLPTATDAGAPLPADTAQTAAPDGMPA